VIKIDFESFRFASPVYLWLLLIPAALMVVWGWRVVRRRANVRRLAAQRIVPVPQRFGPVDDLAFWACVLIAAGLCIAAIARPQARLSSFRKASADIVILQDASASMYVTDVRPDRWRRSVQFLRTFAETLSWKGDRVALALFAQLAAPQVRLTKDPNALFFFIDNLGERSPFRLENTTTWDTNIEEGFDGGFVWWTRTKRSSARAATRRRSWSSLTVSRGVARSRRRSRRRARTRFRCMWPESARPQAA